MITEEMKADWRAWKELQNAIPYGSWNEHPAAVREDEAAKAFRAKYNRFTNQFTAEEYKELYAD